MSQIHRYAVLVGVSVVLTAALIAPGMLSADQAIHETGEVSVAAGDSACVYASGPEILGASGNLRALIGTPDALRESPVLQPLLLGVPFDAPGVYPLGFIAPDRQSLVVVSLAPLDAIKEARLDGYRVGRWPTRGSAARYAQPSGFIPVTPANESTPVSKRFRLRDFLTHDQQDVWPKVLVLRAPLVDKLELIGDELENSGLSGSLHVMSGFRTPQYNAQGVGSKGGRAGASRHMYGDAADVFVDADGDGMMDDLDGDGRITVRDARVLLAAAERVETQHPDLVGGLSAYPASSAHGPFVHVDTRGVRARW